MVFFARYLKREQNGWEQRPVVQYFQMGDDTWRMTSDWYGVAQSVDTLFLRAGRAILEAPATASEAPDSFTCKPRDPTPALGGSRFDPFDESVIVGPVDLSAAIEQRGDVIVFSTPAFTTPLVLDGQVTVDLSVSIDRTDADVAVRLCDVYPDGRSMIMQQGIQRLRFRESLTTATLATPGTVYPVRIVLPDLALTFLPGHRLRLVISGADYPHFDLNLSNGGAMYAAGDTLPVKIRIHHDAQNPSRVILPLGPGSAGVRGDVPRRATAQSTQGTLARIVLGTRPQQTANGVRVFDIRGRSQRLTGEDLRIGERPLGVFVLLGEAGTGNNPHDR
jgi:putative CocE/NonD family hydrolase